MPIPLATALPQQAIEEADKVRRQKYKEHAQEVANQPGGLEVLNQLIDNHQAQQQAQQQPQVDPSQDPKLMGGMSPDAQFVKPQGLLSPAKITPEGNIQEGGGLSWIGGHSTGDLLKKLLVLSDIKKKQEPSLGAELEKTKYEEKKQNAMYIANAIESGDQLADFTSLYGAAAPVKAELEKRGIDVQKLQLQAISEKKLAQTLNGPQQTRLRQSIDSVVHGLDELDSLNEEFQRSGIKAYNKAQLEAYANGAGTPEQQDIAQRFKTQMIGLQDEFGNVVMGGNSPTDKALELAGKMFNSNFNNTAIAATTKQARRLLKMRKNAIENVGVAGSYGAGKKTEMAPEGSASQSGQSNQEFTEHKKTGIKYRIIQ